MSYAGAYAQVTTTTPRVEDSSVKAVWIIVQWFVIFVKLAWPAFFVCAYCQVGIFKGCPYHFTPKLRYPLYILTTIASIVTASCLWDSFSTTDFGGYTSIDTGFPGYCPHYNGTLLDKTRTGILEMSLIILLGHGILAPIFRCALKRTVGNSFSVLVCWVCSTFWLCLVISFTAMLPDFCDMNEQVILQTYNACMLLIACTFLTSLIRLGHFIGFKCAFRRWQCDYFGIDDSLTIVSNMHIEEVYSKYANLRAPTVASNAYSMTITDIPPEPAYVAMEDGVSSNKGRKRLSSLPSRPTKTSIDTTTAYDDSSETTISTTQHTPEKKRPLLRHKSSRRSTKRKESINPFDDVGKPKPYVSTKSPWAENHVIE